MSELAYNLNGESFELPGAAVAWRVRKLKPKGAPEVVYGREGIPLILPIDADMDDLRREARNEGKYRLDPVDEHSRPIPGCPAGYVCVHDGEPTVEVERPPVAKPVPLVTTADQALVEAMRIQAGLAQSVVDKFAAMLEASATLLRAAQNAGMPQRLPRFFLDVGEDDDGDHQDKADEKEVAEAAQAAPKTGLPAIIDSFMTAAAPAFVNAIVNGRIKIPGGLGALIDCRRAVPKDGSAAAPSTFIRGTARARGPRDPAPATEGPVTPARRPSPPWVARADAAPAATPSAFEESEVATAAAATDVPEGLPTIAADTMQHFTNIINALTLREQMHAQALAAELSPAEMRAWIQELKSLSIEAGAAKIRAVIGSTDGRPSGLGGSGAGGTSPASGSSGALGTGGVS